MELLRRQGVHPVCLCIWWTPLANSFTVSSVNGLTFFAQDSPKKDERFINGLRVAALPKFRKLWGRIDTDLREGDTVSCIWQAWHWVAAS